MKKKERTKRFNFLLVQYLFDKFLLKIQILIGIIKYYSSFGSGDFPSGRVTKKFLGCPQFAFIQNIAVFLFVCLFGLLHPTFSYIVETGSQSQEPITNL